MQTLEVWSKNVPCQISYITIFQDLFEFHSYFSDQTLLCLKKRHILDIVHECREGARGGCQDSEHPKNLTMYLQLKSTKKHNRPQNQNYLLYSGQERRHPNSQTYFTTLPADDESQNKSVNYIPNQIQM